MLKFNLIGINILFYNDIIIVEGSQCKDRTRGFPDNPISKLSTFTRSSTVTLLIPAMNFICNATIAGFVVAGRSLNRAPHSQLQIWRSQNSAYYRIGSIPVNTVGNGRGVCSAISRIVNITYWCMLFEVSQVSVQPGDILGLQLPNNNLEILFTSGGPVNYIFHEHEYLLDPTVGLSLNESYSNAQQLPQIMLNFTSGKHCLCMF